MANKELDPTSLLGKFWKMTEKAISGAADKELAKRALAERVLRLTPANPQKIQETKVAAKETVKNIRAGTHKDVSKAEAELRATNRVTKTLKDAKEIQREAEFFAEIRGDAPGWLKGASSLSRSDAAAELVATATFMPETLRDDPYVLYKTVRHADLHFDFRSASDEAILEYKQVRSAFIKRIQERIQVVRPSDPGIEQAFEGFENDGVFGEKFDLYRTKKLPEVTATAAKPQKKKNMNPQEFKAYNEEMEKWIEANIPGLQRRDLDSDLEVWQKNFDASRYLDKDDELRDLNEIEKKLKQGKEIRSKSEQGVDIRRSAYNQDQADEHLEKIYQRRRVVQIERVSEAQQQREVAHAEQREGEFSQIFLQPSEIKEATTNFAVFAEKFLRKLEASDQDPNGSYFKSQIQRLELAAQMFGSEYFDRQVLNFATETDKNKVFEYVDSLSKVKKRKLSEYISARLDGLYNNYALGHSYDAKQFIARMQAFGDKGILQMAASDGGLVGDWAGRYEQILANLVKNDQRLYSTHEAQASSLAVEQLLAEKDLHSPAYKKFYKEFQIPGKDLTEDFQTLDRSAAESIVRRAKTVARLRMRRVPIMERGLGPGEGAWEDANALPSFATLSMEEKMMGASRIRDWFMRKWGNVHEFLKVWNTGALFTAKADHRLWEYVQEQTDGLWNAAKSPGSTPQEKQKALERIGFLIKNNGVPREVLDIKAPSTPNYDFQSVISGRLAKMKKKDLELLVAIEEGGFRMQRMLRPYVYMDSLWREKLFQQHMEMGFTHGDKLFLGAKLRGAGEDFFFNPLSQDDEAHEVARSGLLKALEEVTNYRPQGIADFFRHSKDADLQSWFDANHGSFGTEDIHEGFGELNRRFLMINQQILRDNAEPINYSQLDRLIQLSQMTPQDRSAAIASMPATDPAKQQWTYIERAFSVEDQTLKLNSPEQYLISMKNLHSHLTHRTGNEMLQLQKLTEVQFDRYFLHMPWEDDIPAHLLQDAEIMEGKVNARYKDTVGTDLDGNPLPFSHLLTDQGVGPGAPLPRAWSDFDLSIQTFDAFIDFNFKPDEKGLIELMGLMYKNIKVYQGPYLASEAVIKTTASWLGSAQVKPEFGNFLTGLMDSSVFKEARGHEAPSLSLDNVYETLGEIEKNITRLDENAPHMMHALERFLRLSTVHVMGREVKIPGIAPEGISWHSIFKFAKDVPGLKSVITPKFLSRLERGSPLGLASYKVMLLTGLVAAIVVAAAAVELKTGGKGKEESQH